MPHSSHKVIMLGIVPIYDKEKNEVMYGVWIHKTWFKHSEQERHPKYERNSTASFLGLSNKRGSRNVSCIIITNAVVLMNSAGLGGPASTCWRSASGAGGHCLRVPRGEGLGAHICLAPAQARHCAPQVISLGFP